MLYEKERKKSVDFVWRKKEYAKNVVSSNSSLKLTGYRPTMETIDILGYMCYVEGTKTSKKVHLVYKLAEDEAHRLSDLNPTRNVYILAPVLKLAARELHVPKVTVKKKRIITLPDIDL